MAVPKQPLFTLAPRFLVTIFSSLRALLLNRRARCATLAFVATLPSLVSAGGTSVVASAADSGPGSLRQAITVANADTTAVVGSPHTITFNIPGSGVQTISPATALPPLTRPVVIDGITQAGSSCGGGGVARAINIRLRGLGNATSATGLLLTGGGSTVQGLNIAYWKSGNLISTGITGGDTIRCNHIGTDVAGVSPDIIGATRSGNPNTSASVDISSPNTVLGGRSRTASLCDGDCNVIAGESGNSNQVGVLLRFGTITSTGFNDLPSTSAATAGAMQGNFIGIGQTGQNFPPALKTGRLILIVSTDAATPPAPAVPHVIPSSGGYSIGGLDVAHQVDVQASNVISGAKFRDGIDCDTAFGCASGVRVYGNFIGTGPTGNEATDAAGIIYGNARDGVQAEGAQSIDIQANVISGNGNNGVNIASISNDSIIRGNIIGLTANGDPDGNGWYSTAFPAGNPNVGMGGATVNANAASGNGVSIGGFGCATPNRDCANLRIDGNVIAVSARAGIIALNGTGGMTIQGNHVGITMGGVARPNGAAGLIVMTDNNLVTDNVIATNGGPGITILRNTNTAIGTVISGYTPVPATATNNRLARNSIYGNTQLGIDLAAVDTTWTTAGNTLSVPYSWTSGVTPNDGALGPAPPANTGTFGNRAIDYPVFTSAVMSPSAGTLTVSGFVGRAGGSAAFAGATVEVFKADNAPSDQNGSIFAGDSLSVAHGEGRTYLGSCTADGAAVFSGCVLALPPAAPVNSWALGDTISGTASLCTSNPCLAPGAAGFSSEFGPNLPVDYLPTVRIAKVSVGGVGAFAFDLQGFDNPNDTVTTTIAGAVAMSPQISAGAIGGTVTLTETSATATGYTTSIGCIDTNGAASGNGGASIEVANGLSVSIPAANMVSGAAYLCTFTNVKDATLSVSKIIAPASPAVTGSFPFSVSCDTPAGVYNGSVAVTAGSVGDTTISIPAGSTNCTVAETLAGRPTAPAGYAWAAPTYTQPTPTAMPAGGTADATMFNALQSGSLQIGKAVSQALPQAVTFNFTLDCSPPATTPTTTALGPSVSIGQTISIAAGGTAGGTSAIGPIAAGSTCTVIEIAPATIPNYSWGNTPGPNSGIAISNATTALTSFANILTNTPTSVSGRVYREGSDPANAKDDGNGIDPGLSGVAVTISCSAPSFARSTATAANGGYSFSGVPAGANCTITETQPAGYTNAYSTAGAGGAGTGGGATGTGGDSTIALVVPAEGSTGNNFAEQSADMVSSATCNPSSASSGTHINCTVICTNQGPGTAVNAFCSITDAASLPGAPTPTCAPNANVAVGGTLTCTVNFTIPDTSGSIIVNGGTGADNDLNGGNVSRAGNNSSDATLVSTLPVPVLNGPLLAGLALLLLISGLTVAGHRCG